MLVQSIASHDFDELASGFAGWDCRFTQLEGGRFEGRLAFAAVGGVQLFDVEANRAFWGRGARTPGTCTVTPVVETNAAARYRGRTLRPGMLNLLDAHQAMDHRTSDRYRNASVVVGRDLLCRAARVLAGVDLDRLLPDQAAPVVDPNLCEGLSRHIRTTLETLVQRPPGELSEPESKALVHGLLRRLVWTLSFQRVEDPLRTTPEQRRRVVRMAEQHVLAHLGETVSILDLCALTEVGERTLHYAFLDTTGLSPKAFLKAIRLNHARSDLRAAEPSSGVIAAIAGRWGFSRPDHFAADFQRHFGELPSTLLRGRRR